MISIKLIFISLLTSQVTGASLLERLLDSTIKSAMCEARCGGLEDAEDAQMCLEICKMVTMNPGTASLCGVASLCTAACQAGCGEAVEAEDIKLTSLEQDGCGLSWELETQADRVVFIVSGLDSAGMISIVSSSLEDPRLTLTSAMRERFTQMTVLAVGASGLEDIRTVAIEKMEAECEVRDVDSTTPSSTIELMTTQNVQSNINVDVKMIVPQMSPEILACCAIGVILLVFIIILFIRDLLRCQNKKLDIAFTKLEAFSI